MRGPISGLVGAQTFVVPPPPLKGEFNSRGISVGHRLQNKVIDLEVEARTCSPSIDPSVRTILIGHSMG